MTDTPVPPHNLDAEESILGACMLSAHVIDACVEVLRPGDWYRQSHEAIWDAIVELHGQGQPTDAIAVVNRLGETGRLEKAQGADRVHELAALVPAAGNAPHYARIVRDLAVLRGLIRAGTEIARLGWDRPGETTELVDKAEQAVFALGQQHNTSDLHPIREGLDETWHRIGELAKHGRSVVGVPSGFADLDRLTSGFQPGNLIIVAARPSMGKTALGLAITARVTLREQLPVALFTLEMNRAEIQQRLLSMEGRVNSLKLRNGSLSPDDWTRLTNVAGKLNDAPLFVEDTGTVTMTELRSKARKFVARHRDTALIVIDYLQLMASGSKAENRNQEISQISRSLKMLAGELQVPIIALSQLSRDVEKRHDKRPMLSDLRDSGSLEQDADLVLFLYRDAYYNAEDAFELGTEGICEVNLAKHRNGPTDTVKLAWISDYALFGNLAHHP